MKTCCGVDKGGRVEVERVGARAFTTSVRTVLLKCSRGAFSAQKCLEDAVGSARAAFASERLRASSAPERAFNGTSAESLALLDSAAEVGEECFESLARHVRNQTIVLRRLCLI